MFTGILRSDYQKMKNYVNLNTLWDFIFYTEKNIKIFPYSTDVCDYFAETFKHCKLQCNVAKTLQRHAVATFFQNVRNICQIYKFYVNIYSMLLLRNYCCIIVNVCQLMYYYNMFCTLYRYVIYRYKQKVSIGDRRSPLVRSIIEDKVRWVLLLPR